MDYRQPDSHCTSRLCIAGFTTDGTKCVIKYALVVDNAGRRWEARQRQGKPAKRIRWYSRSGDYYPVEWQNVLGRGFRILKSKAKG